jgi:hypothetical protein
MLPPSTTFDDSSNARLFKQWFGYDLPPIQAQY